MATAAPAAPASASPAPAASPSAAPATPAPAPATPAAAKPIRPIPPPPRLPGVMEDGPEDATSPDAVAARARDAAGRFAKPGGEPTVVGKPQPRALDAADGIPELPGQEPKPEPAPKFKFAGKEYESQAEAEHAYQSVIGRQKALAETEGQLVKAAESARGWHAEAQRFQARIAELEAGAGAQPAAEPAPEAQGIDWEMYAEISRVAAEAGTPWKAQQWLQEQVDAQRAADIAALRREAIELPRERAAEQAQLESTAATLIDSMAANTNPDGSPTFPEFRDGDQAREVGALWSSLGLDPRLALTPGGAVAAVALYRMARGMDTPPAAGAPAPPTPAHLATPPSPAAEAAAALEGGRPLAPAGTNTRSMDPGVARLVAGLKNTQLIRPGLGFEA